MQSPLHGKRLSDEIEIPSGVELKIPANEISKLIDQARRDGVEKLLAGALLIQEGRVLILERVPDDFMGGLKELPSGHAEQGEGIVKCLLRELKEETDLNLVSVDNYCGSFDYRTGSGKLARQLNFAVSVENAKVTVNSSEHVNYLWWLPSENYQSMNISEATASIILNYIQQVSGKGALGGD